MICGQCCQCSDDFNIVPGEPALVLELCILSHRTFCFSQSEVLPLKACLVDYIPVARFPQIPRRPIKCLPVPFAKCSQASDNLSRQPCPPRPASFILLLQPTLVTVQASSGDFPSLHLCIVGPCFSWTPWLSLFPFSPSFEGSTSSSSWEKVRGKQSFRGHIGLKMPVSSFGLNDG